MASGTGAGVERRAAMLGVVAGMRSQLPLALMALVAGGGEPEEAATSGGEGSRRSVLRSPAARIALGAVAVGEIVGDKLPMTPSRLAPGPFLGRLAFGALVGGVFAARAGGEAMVGAAAGGTGAVIGTIAFGEARVALARLTGLPDWPWAIAEDALAVGLGLAALRRPG